MTHEEREEREREREIREMEREEREREREIREMEREWEREIREMEREERQGRERKAEREEREREREERERERKRQDDVRREEIAYNNALPKCKWCGKQYSFAPEANSFFEYCSKKCATEDLGQDKAEEYSQTGLDKIKEQINDAFEKGDFYKAIVLSEGYSEFFSISQHILVANMIVEHRRYFLSENDLVLKWEEQHNQAFDKASESQYFVILYSILTDAELVKGFHVCLPKDSSEQRMIVFVHYLCKFVNRYTHIKPEHWEYINKTLKKFPSNALQDISRKSSSTILNSMIEEEEQRRKTEEEEERRRKKEEEKELRRIKVEGIKEDIQKLAEQKNHIASSIKLNIFYSILFVILFACLLIFIVVIFDDDGLRYTIPFFLFFPGIIAGKMLANARIEKKNMIEVIEQKINTLKQKENKLASKSNSQEDDEEKWNPKTKILIDTVPCPGAKWSAYIKFASGASGKLFLYPDSPMSGASGELFSYHNIPLKFIADEGSAQPTKSDLELAIEELEKLQKIEEDAKKEEYPKKQEETKKEEAPKKQEEMKQKEYPKKQEEMKKQTKKEETEINVVGKHVVLAGEFTVAPKERIERLLKESGAIVQSSVTLETEMVIVGKKERQNMEDRAFDSEVERAKQLQSTGQSIQILNEEDVFE